MSWTICYDGRAMNHKLTLLGIASCAALAFSSCQSSKDAEFDDTDAETAVMIADGAIPPWLQEDTSGAPQVPAGHMTRNDVSFPEPGSDPLAGLDAPTPPPSAHAASSSSSRRATASTSRKSTTKSRKRGGRPGLYIYTVQKGDTLSLISQQSGTPISAIKKASGLKSNTIIVGQKIKVPYKIKAPTITGKRGKTSRSASRASAPTVRYAKTKSYTVKKGETLRSVAKKFGSTEKAIRNATGLKSNTVRAGQTVKIPM